MPAPRPPFLLTCFTNDPRLALTADGAGVDRIGLDLEQINKASRQGHLDAWISTHRECELPALRGVVRRGKLFVRTNPPHPGLRQEVDRLVRAGAEVLMLPYFRSPDEVSAFVDAVGGRAEVALLIETSMAVARLERIIATAGIHDIHIGLNDLHLSLGLDSHFELLVSALMEWMADTLNASGIPWGFGGIGRAMDERLPVPSDLIYAQYARLGARAALVSRSFLAPEPFSVDMSAEVARARDRMDYWFEADPAAITAARDRLIEWLSRRERARSPSHPV